jgi:hypothetical protein
MRARKITRSGELQEIGARCSGGRSAMLCGRPRRRPVIKVIVGTRAVSVGYRSGVGDHEGGLLDLPLGLRGHKGLLSNREGGSLILDSW